MVTKTFLIISTTLILFANFINTSIVFAKIYEPVQSPESNFELNKGFDQHKKLINKADEIHDNKIIIKEIEDKLNYYNLPINKGKIELNKKSGKLDLEFKNKKFSIEENDLLTESKLVKGNLIRMGKNNKVNSSIESVDGGVRIILSITDNTSLDYQHDFRLTTNDNLIYKTGTENTVNIIDINTNKIITSILKPWAIDSNNQKIKTWYSIEDNGKVLRQHVDLRNAILPVIADPTWCGNTIDNVKWGWYISNGIYKYYYSVSPTWCGRYSASTGAMWDEMLSVKPIYWFSWASFYKKDVNEMVNSMYHQLECHNIFGFFQKERYNLDVWRRDAPTYWDQYNAKCNVD